MQERGYFAQIIERLRNSFSLEFFQRNSENFGESFGVLLTGSSCAFDTRVTASEGCVGRGVLYPELLADFFSKRSINYALSR